MKTKICEVHSFKLGKGSDILKTCCVCGYRLPKTSKSKIELPVWKNMETKNFVIRGYSFEK